MIKKDVASKRVIAVIAAALSLFHLYTALFGVYTPILQGGIHLFTLLALSMLMYTGKKSGEKDEEHISLLRLFLFITVVVIALIFLFSLSPDEILKRGVFGPTRFEQWIGLCVLIFVLEGTRRTVGLPIVIVALIFIIYALFGRYMPSAIAHKGYSIWRLIDNLSWTTQGIFGIPIAVSSTSSSYSSSLEVCSISWVLESSS